MPGSPYKFQHHFSDEDSNDVVATFTSVISSESLIENGDFEMPVLLDGNRSALDAIRTVWDLVPAPGPADLAEIANPTVNLVPHGNNLLFVHDTLDNSFVSQTINAGLLSQASRYILGFQHSALPEGNGAYLVEVWAGGARLDSVQGFGAVGEFETVVRVIDYRHSSGLDLEIRILEPMMSPTQPEAIGTTVYDVISLVPAITFIPEPSTCSLLLLGILGLFSVRCRFACGRR